MRSVIFSRRSFLGRSTATLLGFSLARCGYHDFRAIGAGGPVPLITPTERHFVKNGAEGSIAGWQMPSISAGTWSATIDGLVDQPLTLTMADIEAESAQSVEVLKTMQCVVDASGALVATSKWGGVPLRLFLDRAGVVVDRARRLHFEGADGFRNNLPLSRLYDPTQLEELSGPLLVTHMNGQPLTREHGGPVRLLVPDGYGFASVKWLTRITATEDDSAYGTYQDTGFTDETRAPISSRVTAPSDNLSVPAGAVVCHGFAVSGHGGIERVEVRVDGGPWQPATLATAEEAVAAYPELAQVDQFKDPARFPFPLRSVWAPWRFVWQATPGRHVLQVRAFDRSGQQQPETDQDIADGVNAYASVRVEVI